MNRDNAEARDKILFEQHRNSTTFGGIRKFAGVLPDAMRRLIELEVADPEDQQNAAPTLMEFIEFCEGWNKKYSGNRMLMHGYAVDPDREDYRVSVEGLISEYPNQHHEKMTIEFLEFNRFADELDLTPHLRSWWD